MFGRNRRSRDELLDELATRINLFTNTGQPHTVLDPAAVAVADELLALVPDFGTDIDVCVAVGGLYWCRWLVLGDGEPTADLRQASDFFVHVQRERPSAVPGTLSMLYDDMGYSPAALRAGPAAGEWVEQGSVLLEEFRRTGDLAAVDRAIELFRRALDVTSPNHEFYTGRAEILAVALKEKTITTTRLSDLDEMIATLRTVVSAEPRGADLSVFLGVLAEALQTRYRFTGDHAALNESIDSGWRAYRLCADENAASYLTTLGGTLLFRFDALGRADDLDQAVNVLSRALRLPGAAQLTAELDTAGVLCGAVADWLASVAAPDRLAEVVGLAAEAISRIANDHPQRTAHLISIGVGLLVAHERTGDAPAVRTSAEMLRAALPTADRDDRGRGYVLRHLAIALQRQYELSDQLADLADYITIGRQAVALLTPEADDRWDFIDTFATLLGSFALATGQHQLLDEAVDRKRQAVSGVPATDPRRPLFLSNLAMLLGQRFQVIHRTEDLDEAIALVRASISTIAQTDPHRIRLLCNLVRLLELAYRDTGEFAALDEARALSRTIAAYEQAMP